MIVSNSDVDPRRQVVVAWNAQQRVELHPVQIDFGSVEPGSVVEQEFELRTLPEPDAPPLTILDVSPTGEDVACQLPSGEMQAVTQGVVTATVGTSPGRQLRAVRIALSDRPTEPLLLHLVWTVEEPVSAIPPRLSFGVQPPGAQVERRVELLAPRGSLTVDSAEVAAGSWVTEVSVDRVSDSTVAVVLRGQVPADEGAHAAELQVAYSSPRAGRLAIPVSVVAAAGLSDGQLGNAPEPQP